MSTEVATPVPASRWRFLRPFLVFGPGLVFVLGSVGPRDLITNAMAGATYGYSLIWLIAAALIARFVILDTTARYVVVTGESLLQGCGRRSRTVVVSWFVLSILKRHVSTLVDFTLLGTSAHFVFPLPTRHSIAIWSLVSWVAGFTLMYWGRYRVVEKISRPLAFVLGGSLAAVAILSRPNLAELAKGAFSPAIPSKDGAFSSAIVLMALLSAATGSFSNLKYSAYVHEKGWRKLSFLGRQRTDLMLSMFGLFIALSMVQIAAAGALRPRGIEVGRLEDLIPIFATVLGGSAQVLLGATLWAVVFSSYVDNGTAYGIMISDVYHRFIRPSAAIPQHTLGDSPSGLPAYRWLVVYIFLSPLYVLLTDWSPLFLVIVKSALSAVTLPVIIAMVIRMTSDRRIMGDLANGWLRNAFLVFTLLSALYVSGEGVYDLVSGKGLK
jgi:Mn2+/Fe2+ NRAMP family transporter